MTETLNEVQTLVNDFLTKHPGKESELADGLLVSIPTIKRWGRGTNLPSPLIARAVVAYLKQRVSDS